MTAIQKAREALVAFADPMNWVVNGRFDPHSGNFDATTFARSALAALDAETPATPADVGELVERLRKLVIIDEVNSVNPLGRDAATALERFAAENIRLVHLLNTATEEFTALRDASTAEITTLREKLETVEAETRKRCARELLARRLALEYQTVALDIDRERAIYDICIDAIRNLEPRHD